MWACGVEEAQHPVKVAGAGSNPVRSIPSGGISEEFNHGNCADWGGVLMTLKLFDRRPGTGDNEFDLDGVLSYENGLYLRPFLFYSTGCFQRLSLPLG